MLQALLHASWVWLHYSHHCNKCCKELWRNTTHIHTHTIPWCRMFGSQVTNTQILPDPTFLEPYNCNKVTIDSDTPLFFLLSLASVENMALHNSVMQSVLYFVWVICGSIFWRLTIVKLKFCTVTMISPQHLHINNFDRSLSFYL